MAANAEVYVPPKKYKTGTTNFEYNFNNKANFIGLVMAKSEDGSKIYVSRLLFAVGETATKDMTIYAFFSILGILAFGLCYRHTLS